MFLVGTEEARREPWKQAEQGGVHPAWGLGCSGDPGELALVSSHLPVGPSDLQVGPSMFPGGGLPRALS